MLGCNKNEAFMFNFFEIEHCLLTKNVNMSIRLYVYYVNMPICLSVKLLKVYVDQMSKRQYVYKSMSLLILTNKCQCLCLHVYNLFILYANLL